MELGSTNGSSALSPTRRLLPGMSPTKRRASLTMSRSLSEAHFLESVAMRARPGHLGLRLDIEKDQAWYERKAVLKRRIGGPLPGEPMVLTKKRPIEELKWPPRDHNDRRVWGSKTDLGPVIRPVPRPLEYKLKLKLARSGNWALPDTPRCAALALAADEMDKAARARRLREAELRAKYDARLVGRLLTPEVVPIIIPEPTLTLEVASYLDNIEPPPSTAPSTRGTPNKFRKLVRKAYLFHVALMGFMVPQRKVRKSLLKIKLMLAEEAHRVVMWEWGTVIALFRVQETAELPWAWLQTTPRQLDSELYPLGVFDSAVPHGSIRLKKLGQLLRYLGLTVVQTTRLLEARFGEIIDGCCQQEVEEQEFEDELLDIEFAAKEWRLLPEFLEDGDSKEHGGTSRQNELCRYEDFKTAMWPTPEELLAFSEAQRARTLRRKTQDASKAARASTRQTRLLKRRQWALGELMEALNGFPTVRKNQPAFTTKGRHGALKFVMTAGVDANVNGTKAIEIGTSSASEHHVSLRDPGMRQCLINCCTSGAGYGGFTAVEIVETFYTYCAERIQAAWRGRRDGRRFRIARQMWKRKDHGLLRRILKMWRTDAENGLALRVNCLRKLVAWRFQVAVLKKKRELFRLCFWPMHVWRKAARNKSVAREKAKFLRLVWRVLLKKWHLKAWRLLARERRRVSVMVEANYLNHLRARRLEVPMREWIRRARQRRRLRAAWHSRDPRGGRILARHRKRSRAGRVLAVWKYYVFLAKKTKAMAATWFRRIRFDDEAKQQLIREIKRSRGTKRRELHRELDILAQSRPRPPSLPTPDEAECFLRPQKKQTTEKTPEVEPAPASSTLNVEQRSLCGPLRVYFEETIFPRELAACWLLYWRSGPSALAMLAAHTLEKRKENRAHQLYAQSVLRRILKMWVQFYKETKAEAAIELIEQQQQREQLLEDVEEDEEVEPVVKRAGSAGALRRSKSKTASSTKVLVVRKTKKKKKKKKLTKSGTSSEDLDPNGHDREERLAQADRVTSTLKGLRDVAAGVRVTAIAEKIDDDRRVEIADLVQVEMTGFLRVADLHAATALTRATKFVAGFPEHAAQQLVDSVYRVRSAAIASYDRGLQRAAIRAMRMPWALKRSASLMRRQILRRRLNICVRWRKLERGMPLYRSLRTKWLLWNQWIRLVNNHLLWRSPGLTANLDKRQQRSRRVSDWMREHQPEEEEEEPFSKKTRVLQPKREAFVGFEVIWLRWAKFAQDRARWRQVQQLLASRRSVQLKKRVMAAFRAEAGLLDDQHDDVPAALRRCEADLSTLRARFLSVRRRRDLTPRFRRQNLIRALVVKQSARDGPSFKKLLLTLRVEARARFRLEQKILVDAFAFRGSFLVSDVKIEAAGAASAAAEEVFADADDCPKCAILSKIEVVTQRGRGILGIGGTRRGDSDFQDLPFRGSVDGHRHVLELTNYNERFTAVELLLGGNVIEALRFEISVFGNEENYNNNKRANRYGGVAATTSRFSRWYGQTISSKAEQVTIRGPPGSSIVGFHGKASPARLSWLGLVARSTTRETVFSSYWTPPLPKHSDAAAREEDTAAALIVDDDATIQTAASVVVNEEVDETAQVLEFITVLRYRRADGLNAVTRAEALARRIWKHASSSSKEEEEEHDASLCRLSVVLGLTWWMFSSLCAPLPPLAPKGKLADALLKDARERKSKSLAMRARADRAANKVYQRRAKHDAAAQAERRRPRTEAEAMEHLGPVWRAEEARRNDLDDADLATAVSFRAMAASRLAEAEADEERARSQITRLDPKAPRVRACYARLVELARRQLALERDFSAEAFHENLKAATTGTTDRDTLIKSEEFDRVIEIIRRRRREEAAAKEQELLQPTLATNSTEGSLAEFSVLTGS